MNRFQKIVSIFILTVISIPGIYHISGLKVLNPLKGAYKEATLPSFKLSSFNNLEFQENFEKYIEDHIGLRPQIVKLTNQLNYSLFNELNPQGVIVGKENYLFEVPYLITKAGKDYLGLDSLKRIGADLKWLHQELEKENIHLLVVLAPDKVTFMPEYLPEKFQNRKEADSTNYKIFAQLLKEDSIQHIDFNPLFLSWKDTATYPLYPKYGTHWSSYGWYLAADTILKKLGALSSEKLNSILVEEIEISSKLRDTDYDIGESLNLLCKLPSDPMAYPKLKFENNYSKPDVLVIGDSYYVNIATSDIPEGVFNKHDFLYYNKRVYNNPDKKVNLPEDFKNYNFVIVEATTANIRLLNYGLFKNKEIRQQKMKQSGI